VLGLPLETASRKPLAGQSGGDLALGLALRRPKNWPGAFPQLEIIELLGQGGMGAVYKAKQPTLDRLVAVKILPTEIAADPTFAERFTREARALARLNHPNIVGIYDFGQADGLYYFIMEYVDGASLRQLIGNRQLAPQQALAVVPQICEALQFAHDEGIVHRDVKPENILIDKRGRVKVADFGLAKLLGLSADQATLTRVEQVMGTPLYMAPEQVQGSHAVDHRADIYSLGVVFYEMLTGDLPLGRFAPPSQKVDVDVRLDEVVLRALEREPERRYQNASDVKTDVDAIVARPAHTLAASATSDAKNTCATKVRRAAIGLFILGVVGCIASFVYLIALVSLVQNTSAHGQKAYHNAYDLIVVFAVTLALSVLTMFAAWKMLRFQGYALAVIVSALAITSLSIVGLRGLWTLDSRAAPAIVTDSLSIVILLLFIVSPPVGVWALVVLLRRDVRSEFSAVRKARQDARRPEREMGRHRNVVPLVTVLTALVCLLGMGTAFLPWAEISMATFGKPPASAIGFMWWQGMFVGFAFVAMAALLMATVSMARMPAWRPVVVGTGALAVIAAAAHFLAEFSRGDLPVEPLLTAAHHRIHINGKTPSTIREANLTATRRNGAYLAMLVAAGVLMLTVVETAVAHAPDRSPADGGPSADVAGPPGRG